MTEPRFRNFTGKDLNLLTERGGLLRTIPSEGRMFFTANYRTVYSLDVNGHSFPVVSPSPLEVSLPDPVAGVYLIVTGLVASLHPERGDLLSPARIMHSGYPGGGCRAFLSQTEREDDG